MEDAGMASWWQDLTGAPIFRGIHSALNPQEAYEEAEKQAQRGMNQAQGTEQPWINQGQAQYDPLNQARTNLLDPTKLQDEWSSHYQESPYAKQMLGLNRQSGQEAAGAMGLMGSSAALNNIQQGAGMIVNKDRQQYMDDLMKKYMTGIGLGENLYGTGANMAGHLGQQQFQHGVNMGQLGYGEKNAPGEQVMQIAKMIASMYGGGGMGGGGGGM